jgi:hypothetical protein
MLHMDWDMDTLPLSSPPSGTTFPKSDNTLLEMTMTTKVNKTKGINSKHHDPSSDSTHDHYFYVKSIESLTLNMKHQNKEPHVSHAPYYLM